MMWWGTPDWFGWWMLFGGVWMVLLWGAVIGGVFWVVRSLTRRGERSPEGESPLDIAQRRYARGEITREEFEEMKEALR